MARKTILCFGDSNTFGLKPINSFNALGRFDLNTRWPSRLRAKLGENFHVVEEGLPGRTIIVPDPLEGAHLSGMDALPIIFGSHWPVDGMIVMLGTNDCKDRYTLSPSEIGWGMTQLLSKIQSSGCGPNGKAPKIILAAPADIYSRGVLAPWMTKAREKSLALAGEYQKIAAQMGIEFFDANQVASADTEDGVHLDEQSHVKLGDAFYEIVAKMFEN